MIGDYYKLAAIVVPHYKMSIIYRVMVSSKYCSYYRPRSRGANTFGSTRVSVCLSVGTPV